MERMNEAQRMGSLLFAFFLTLLMALCHWELTRNERMALQGYLPHRVEGSVEVYWFKPLRADRPDPLKGF